MNFTIYYFCLQIEKKQEIEVNNIAIKFLNYNNKKVMSSLKGKDIKKL